ncbi:hypothetical protein ACSBR2_022507 [Camellia fascicularis]
MKLNRTQDNCCQMITGTGLLLMHELDKIPFMFSSTFVHLLKLFFLIYLMPKFDVCFLVAGSKEEAFFDSQPWLESDCDDDFFSVNGDFTPSRGSTPVHHSSSAGTARANRALFDDKTPGSQPEPSPRKTLADFFRDSLRSNQDVDEQNILSNQNGVNEKIEAKTTMLGLHPISVNGTPFVSGANSVCSSERTPNGDYRPQKEKPMKSVQCCLPRILSSRSFNERKKRTSPARSVG